MRTLTFIPRKYKQVQNRSQIKKYSAFLRVEKEKSPSVHYYESIAEPSKNIPKTQIEAIFQNSDQRGLDPIQPYFIQADFKDLEEWSYSCPQLDLHLYHETLPNMLNSY